MGISYRILKTALANYRVELELITHIDRHRYLAKLSEVCQRFRGCHYVCEYCLPWSRHRKSIGSPNRPIRSWRRFPSDQMALFEFLYRSCLCGDRKTAIATGGTASRVCGFRVWIAEIVWGYNFLNSLIRRNGQWSRINLLENVSRFSSRTGPKYKMTSNFSLLPASIRKFKHWYIVHILTTQSCSMAAHPMSLVCISAKCAFALTSIMETAVYSSRVRQ